MGGKGIGIMEGLQPGASRRARVLLNGEPHCMWYGQEEEWRSVGRM
jgi:hypothetical protein